MLKRRLQTDLPTHRFPYAEGTYIFDDKDNLGFAEAFRNAATIANPLAQRSGTHREIGRHIEMKVGNAQTSIVIHKGAPPKAFKILASQIKGQLHSLMGGHVELFEETKNGMVLLMSFARLEAINVRDLTHTLFGLLKKRKHYLRLYLYQTDVGGAMQSDRFHTSNMYTKLLRGY